MLRVFLIWFNMGIWSIVAFELLYYNFFLY
jgi:hypothetical protein